MITNIARSPFAQVMKVNRAAAPPGRKPPTPGDAAVQQRYEQIVAELWQVVEQQ
ncbi:hypothetical protein [Streptomyces sp. ISL-100]|uniref:hypothetical protein n=1 Tax=Streptomyces sp. ISL-100 TaxID=2819173 RepID=UPI001BE9C791|nr:hypothetical protein [Streptomyces sp. ISL-100]MBT2401213.1 hypothetical protein [Streptomyces sp. ISL-100]